MDPGHQLAGGEGLGHVVVGAELETQDPVDLVVAGAQDEHRDGLRGPGSPAAQPAADVEAVEVAGQADVDDDQFGSLPVDEAEAGLGVVGLEDTEAVASEVHGDQVGDVVVVLDHHHALLGLRHRTSLPLLDPVSWHG